MKILDKTTQTYKELVLKPGGDTLPIGGIIAFDSDTIPKGWLLCDGRAVSRTKYAELFKAIGTKHGSGDGSTTFNLPNPKGRTLVGKDSTDTDFNTLGKTGGEKTHTLTVSELPSHSHIINSFRQYETGSSTDSSKLGRTTTGADGGSSTIATGGTGENEAHNNLQPYMTTNFIIKAKNTAVVKGDVIQEDGTASETNVYSSVAIDNKIEKIKETVLYENINGTKETVTLSETTENFSYIEVFARYGTAYYTSVKIFSPHDKYFNMVASMMNQLASTGYLASTNYSISGTTITPQYYGEWALNRNSFTGDNKFTIFKVIGYI